MTQCVNDKNVDDEDNVETGMDEDSNADNEWKPGKTKTFPYLPVKVIHAEQLRLRK